MTCNLVFITSILCGHEQEMVSTQACFLQWFSLREHLVMSDIFLITGEFYLVGGGQTHCLVHPPPPGKKNYQAPDVSNANV